MPAVVIQRTPERGQELRPDGAIELVFDRAMNRASVEAALQVSPAVKGSFEWPDERTVRFQPDKPLKRESEYQVTIGAEARANDGNPLDGAYRFRFRTVGYLEVAQVIPADDTQDVEATGTITVIFNRPVVPLQLVSDPTRADLPAQARQPLIIDPPVSGAGEWLNTSIYVFTPDLPLAGGTTYRVRVDAGLSDTTGGVLEEAYTWSFSTQPPAVVWVSPTEDAPLVGVDAAVQVTFNMPVDAASAQAAFRLEGPGGAVDGSATVDGPTLVFTPTN
nr:Ig-like domain-containing protein [Actinomycetales bacterium]